MLIAVLAFALMQQPCPLTIGVAKDGAIFFDRFHGWYKTSPKMLASVLHAGCYTDKDPQPITAVRLVVAANAPRQKVDLVNSILIEEGLNSKQIMVQPWTQYPRKPLRNELLSASPVKIPPIRLIRVRTPRPIHTPLESHPNSA